MNKVQLMGNLARDPKVSVTRTGKTIVRMTVACSETYKGRDGQAKEMTSFVPVTCWPPSSDSAQDLLKGDRVVVLGRFTTNSYEKDGTKHYYSEVTADYVGTVPMTGNVNRKASHATDISPGFDDRHGRGH